MFEDFMNALQNFRRNKTRTLLSLLGVIIGVASVIVITSLGESSTKQIQGTFGSAGLDVVTIRSGFMRKKKDPNYVKFDEAFRTLLFDNVKNRVLLVQYPIFILKYSWNRYIIRLGQ